MKRLKALAELLDSKFSGPFGIRFGLDALLGFIPVLGDFATTAASFYIIMEGAKLGCSWSTLLRMILNVLFENLVDMVPLVGNIFDFYWKANNQNILIIQEHLQSPERAQRKSRIIISTLAVSLIFLLATVLAISILLFIALINLIETFI